MQTENINTYVRIKPNFKNDELICEKYDEKSVLVIKNKEKYLFGKNK